MNRSFTAFTFAAALFTFAGIGVQAQKKPNPAPPISINFDKDATKGQDRFLEYVKISSPNGRTIEKKIYPKIRLISTTPYLTKLFTFSLE